MAVRRYYGGPKDGTHDEHPHPVPAQVIPVYADADPLAVCADEQVVHKLGEYHKAGWRHMRGYLYKWVPAE